MLHGILAILGAGFIPPPSAQFAFILDPAFFPPTSSANQVPGHPRHRLRHSILILPRSVAWPILPLPGDVPFAFVFSLYSMITPSPRARLFI
ncbi:hypothetical protein C8T65DRAFT_651885 [Cerioporus squamosus]|nr:hypothetical protein C8T65DRAFT_651885 [Cerioporus squamosus]